MSRRLAMLFALFVTLLGVTPAVAQTPYSLTILKTDGVGQESGIPIEGVPFQINRLLDLPPTPQAELATMVQQNIAVLTDASPHPMGPALAAITDEEGLARFNNLEPGVYLVREQAYRIGNTDYLQSTPFLVSVPEVGENQTNDVLIRTKNQPLPVVKETDKFCVDNNDPARLTITTGVPEPDKNGELHQYAVVDPIDSRMKYLGNLQVSIAGNGAQELSEGTDYRYSFDDSSDSVIIQFTDSGLSKLAAARHGHPETRVVTSFDATVQDWVAVGEIVPNTAYLIPDGWGFDLKSHVYTPISAREYFAGHKSSVQFVPAVYPMPENKVQDPQRLDAISIPSNPVAICRCLPGQNPPPLPGLPGWPILIGVWGSSQLSSGGGQTNAGAPGVSAPASPAETPVPRAVLPGLSLPQTGLASTGASVIGVIVLAVVLGALGWLLLGKRRKGAEEEGDVT